jgi:aromatic-amino-acid transaminase
MVSMILGEGYADRAAAIATPGGTGAIRQALELIKMSAPGAKVWLSNPTWPNHPSIISYLGMQAAEYRYFDAATRGIDFAGLLDDLGRAAPGDVVLLHGCCHNPTGANLDMGQWAQVVSLLQARGAVPFVDLAYQGFGDGLEEDAAATRLIAAGFPEVLIAASCSKNFGIYRERTGILIALTAPDRKAVVQGNLAFLNRQNYSFPPDHGARLVTMILADDALRADWKAELEEVRLNMLTLRQSLADELRRATNSDRYDFVAHHRGMFSRLGLTEAQVMELRDTHGIYMVGDSRINIAGLNARTVPILAAAIAAVGG